VRLFIAVWPPPEVVDVLRTLERPTIPGLRWTTPDQWHVTLRFIGDADPPDVGPLPTIDAEVTLGPATARLGRRILMVPVHGLDDVAGPTPHLTLARAKRAIPPALVGRPLTARWHADGATLVASETHPDGARYRILKGA